MTHLFESLQVIGDPHVSSKRPGRRRAGYTEGLLEKLEACARLSKERKAFTVITGDLFHRNDENDLATLTKLARVFKKFYATVTVYEGNHDKMTESIVDGDALMLLAETGSLRVVSTNGPFERLQIAGCDVQLFCAQFGSELPTRLQSDSQVNILFTHHDLAFEGAYPGAKDLAPIRGCDLLINGHMHKTTPPVTLESTTFWNPGNIEPLSIDLEDHVPKTWFWVPSNPKFLEGVELPHPEDAFDKSGMLVDAAEQAEVVEQLEKESAFSTAMEEDHSNEANRTDDASVLSKDVEDVLKERGASQAVRLMLDSLMAKVRDAALRSEE